MATTDDDLWQHWLAMARESQDAGLALEKTCLRSSVSWFYYAAYQAVTALLHYRGGLDAPTLEGVPWQSWGHDKTPSMAADQLDRYFSRDERKRLKSSLGQLYKARILADYVGTQAVDQGDMANYRKMNGYMVKMAEAVLIAGR